MIGRILIILIGILCCRPGRQAPYDFLQNLRSQLPARSLSPLDDIGVEGLRDSIEDGNIQRVVAILQNNIKQWSFIESQLLEPNVNLGMPEIFIPLKHLTTTLEILGNIFYVKNQLPEAKDCLERACPLMELLPLALGDVKDNAFLETSTLSSELGIPGVINENTGRVTDGDVGRRNMHIDDAETTYDYAAGCYALLKDVYGKIYGRKGSEPGNGGNRELKAKNNEDIPHTRVGRMKVREDKETAGNKLAMSMSKPSTRLTNQDYAKVCSNRVSDCSVPESFRIKQEIGKKPQSFKLKSPENFTRDYPWNTKEEIFVTSFDRKNTRNVHAVGCIVKVCTTDNAGSAVNKDADEYPSSLLFSPADDNFREEEAEEIFDIQKKIEDLRSPFEHLREELSLVDENHSSKIDDLNHDDEYNVFQDETVNSNSQSMQSIEFLPSSTSDLHKVKASNTDPVISYTHEIASHLEQMLRKFSQTDASSSARRDILRSVKRFFEDLDIQYPGMPYEQYAANMDLGHVYVGIMQHVHDTGFDYVDSELEKWQREIGHSLVIAAITTTTSPVDLTSNSFPNSGDLFAQFSRDDALASSSYQEKVVTADASDLTSHGVEFKDIYLFDSDIGALRELGESGFDFLIGRSSRLFPPDRDQESGTSELGRSNIFLNEAIEGLSDDHSPLKTMVLVDNGEGKVERLVLSHTRSNDDTSDFSIEMMEEELASALRRGVPIETISLPEGWNVHHVDTADVDKSYKTVPTIKDKNRLLVLSAFDLAVHADPRDYYDLTQGFVMGVNEAEKTLIAQRNVESWTELSSDGAAENSEIHEATTSGTTSSNTQKKRRRSDRNKKVFSPKDRPLRYRYEQYRRSTWSEDGLDNNKKVASKLDNEATAALFEDTASSSIGISSLRSSMPTLSSEESAFTLYIFVAFLLVTALLILAMSYYQDTYQKKRNSRGSRIRPAIPTVTKKSSADYDAVPTGLGVLIDFGCWLLQKISSIFSDVDNSESSSETSTYKNMVNAATELGSVVQDTLITAVSQLNSSKSNTSTSRKAPVSKKKIKASSSSPIPRIVAAKEVPLKSTVIADMTTTATCDKNEISVCKTASEEIGDTMKSAEESPHPMEESAFSTKESLHALQIKSDEPLQQLEERKSVSLPLTDMNDYGVGDAPTSAVEMLDLQRALELSKVDTGLSDQASDGGGWRSVEKDGRKKSKMKQQQSADKLPSKGTRSSGIQTPANSINDTRLSLHRQLKNSNKNTSTVAKKDIRGSELKHYGDQALKSVHNKVGLKNSADIAASTAYNSRKVSSASSSQLSNSPKNSTDSEQVGGSVYHNFANQQTMMENRIVSDLSSISVYQRTEGSPQSETVSGYGQINIPYQSMEGAIDDFAENGNVFLNLEPLLMSQDQLTFPMDSFDSNKLWNPLQPDNLFRDGSNFRDFLTGDFLLPSSLPNYSDTSLDEDFNQEFLNGVVNFLNLPGQGDSPEPFAFLNEANNSQSHRRLHEMDELGGGSLHQDSVRTAPNFAACESLQAPIVPSTQSSSNMDGMFGEESVPTAKEEQSSRLSRTEQLPSIELQATSFSSLSPNAPSFQPGGRSG